MKLTGEQESLIAVVRMALNSSGLGYILVVAPFNEEKFDGLCMSNVAEDDNADMVEKLRTIADMLEHQEGAN